MKKILLVTLEYPPQKGGVASYYSGLTQMLEKQGYMINVISQKLLYNWFWPRWLKTYFTLRTATAKDKPDIIFVGQVLPLGTAAYLLRKRVPYVIFAHGMDMLMAQKSWRKQWLVKKILTNAKFVVVNSKYTKQQVERFKIQNPKSKIIVVYPCPLLAPNISSQDVESLRQKLGLAGKQIVLTLGRVVERKGHDLVIKALPEILKHFPNIVYVIAGTGPNLIKLNKLVEDLKISSAVRFVGPISDEERGVYYNLCDIFVMPSRQIGPVRGPRLWRGNRPRRLASNGIGPDVEGFGLAFLEAAQYGKPSLGGKSGGVPEAILDSQTGILVDPQDSSAFSRAVVQLLRDNILRDELGKNAKARDEFTWDKQVQKILTVLQ
ncbi:MAG: Glycosyl transferase group 1 [Parcubacteria group bacterium GW2011_GWC2_45_7]|nr:MAG: Glycosyl transferase group 1 [Parcubacteria group bacterium GW2011_GWC2_45_7]